MRSIATFNFLILMLLLTSNVMAQRGTMMPKWGANLSNTYTWDGSELKPKSSSSESMIWTFDGSVLKPKFGADSSNIYEWNGKELHPRHIHTSDDIYIWNGKLLRPKFGSEANKNVWEFTGRYWRNKFAYTNSNTWVVVGDIPVPVVAAILFDLNSGS